MNRKKKYGQKAHTIESFEKKKEMETKSDTGNPSVTIHSVIRSDNRIVW